MKKRQPLLNCKEYFNYDFPNICWREITINIRIDDQYETNGNNPVTLEEIIQNTTFTKKELFESLSRLSKIGVVKKIGSGKKNATYINLKSFYND